MTKIKMCGLRREVDIEYANLLSPDYIGYVFAEKSRRYVSPERASELTKMLRSEIVPVGVFVNEPIENVVSLVKGGTIAMAQLHGSEDDEYVAELKSCGIPVIQAFVISSEADAEAAERSPADFVLLDSGGGSGKTFDHSLISGITRSFFLAGGLTAENVSEAVSRLRPYAVDASSCLETDGFKDYEKMKAFAETVKNA